MLYTGLIPVQDTPKKYFILKLTYTNATPSCFTSFDEELKTFLTEEFPKN